MHGVLDRSLKSHPVAYFGGRNRPFVTFQAVLSSEKRGRAGIRKYEIAAAVEQHDTDV